MSWQYFFKSRLATWGMSIVLLFVMVLAAKILIQKYRVEKEIAKLESQSRRIKQDNQQLSSMIQYFSTPDYEEKAAREKLGLKKEGEFVVGLPQADETASGAKAQTAGSPNFKKWFNYFFSKPTN